LKVRWLSVWCVSILIMEFSERASFARYLSEKHSRSQSHLRGYD
jgi:hypothetical protein